VAPAPTGNAAGSGSISQPWDLATALAGGSGRGKIQPGDTVWLHGGRYRGAFATTLRGEPDRPIVFRQAPGERATIDGTLRADGSDLWFWGFEIMQSVPKTYGLEARTNNGKFINLVVHGAGSMGVSFWTPGENAELYGCIVYHNGTHENLDHGAYVHNERGTKLLAENIFFDNLAYGIHVYATTRNPPQRNIHVVGNIVFNNGTISHRYRAKGNIIVGGDVPMSGIEVIDNLLFFPGAAGENLRLGYGAVVNGDIVVRGNVVWGGAVALKIGNGTWTTMRVENNTFGGAKELVAAIGMAMEPPLERANVYYESPRTLLAPAVFVRPNRYEPGRAHIAIYNPRSAPAVNVSLTNVLAVGQRFELRDVQNLFGKPALAGTFTGDSVSIPVTETFKTFLLTASGAAATLSDTPR
jgi:hypothetical protein